MKKVIYSFASLRKEKLLFEHNLMMTLIVNNTCRNKVRMKKRISISVTSRRQGIVAMSSTTEDQRLTGKTVELYIYFNLFFKIDS